MDIGVPEILIVLIIVILLFGPGRLSSLGGDLGRSIREFRQGLRGEDQGPQAEQPAKTDEIQSSEGHKV
jgi:sec-independent protein translocase protein TatA